MLNVRIYIQMVDDKKIVTIEEDDKDDTDAAPKILSTLNISLKKLGLSLIMNHSKILKPYEAIYISFYNLQFIK